MQYILTFASLLVVVFFIAGCSVNTESKDDTDTPRLYSLNENIADTVDALIKRDGNAAISLELDEPIPGPGDYDIHRADLLGNSIMLVVSNNIGISVNLTKGARVDTIPKDPGQYMMTINRSRDIIGIVFRNETILGNTLNGGENYNALIHVLDNPLFATETFVREVVVKSESCNDSDTCDAAPECQADSGCEESNDEDDDSSSECLPSGSRCTDDGECCSFDCSGWWVSSVCQ